MWRLVARHPAALPATPTTTVGTADYTVLKKLSTTCCYRGVESLTLTVAVTKGAAQLTEPADGSQLAPPPQQGGAPQRHHQWWQLLGGWVSSHAPVRPYTLNT